MRPFRVWEDNILLEFSVFLLTKAEHIFYSLILSFFSLSSPYEACIAQKMREGMDIFNANGGSFKSLNFAKLTPKRSTVPADILMVSIYCQAGCLTYFNQI